MILIPGLSATDSLHLSDAPTTSSMWDTVKAYDLAHPRPTKRCAARVGRVSLKKSTVLNLLANAFVKAIMDRGTVTAHDIEQTGLSLAQAKPFKDEAFALALLREPRIQERLRDAA